MSNTAGSETGKVDFRLKDIEHRYNFVQKVQSNRLLFNNLNVCNLPLLRNFVSSCKKLIPSFFIKKRSTLKQKTLKKIAKTVKRAKQLALLEVSHC